MRPEIEAYSQAARLRIEARNHLIQRIQKCSRVNPEMGDTDLARRFGVTPDFIKTAMGRGRRPGVQR